MNIKSKQSLRTVIIRIFRPFIVIFALTLVGMLGFEAIEGWRPLDAFYMSIISLTTVGYETPQKLTDMGKLFTCIYLLFSVVIFLYLASEFARHVINININEFFSKRQMDARIKNLKNHYIICGFGRTGRAIASNLSNESFDFIVIEKDSETLKEAGSLGYLTILGDSTSDEVLNEARIKYAKGLFAALNEDADNLFLSLASKGINPDLKIVVRCSKAGNEEKFRKAGLVNVVSPFTISARRMVSTVVRPLVADFLDEIMNTDMGLQLRMEQVHIPENSILSGKSIIDSEIRAQSGAFILAIKRSDKFTHNPTAETILEPNDQLIVLGSTDQLIKLDQIIQKVSNN